MSEYVSNYKRMMAPAGFGDECPVCGEPFDAGSAGIIWPDEPAQIDAISWVRICYGPVADHFHPAIDGTEWDPDDLAMAYIHKDEHIDVI